MNVKHVDDLLEAVSSDYMALKAKGTCHDSEIFRKVRFYINRGEN